MSDLISRQDVPDTNVGDMISRQEILRAFEEMCSCTDYGWDERDFRDLIKKIPSAESERKTGKWIHKHCVWFCSECGENPTKGMGYVQGHQELYDFCPKCGADMRGTGDNSDE